MSARKDWVSLQGKNYIGIALFNILSYREMICLPWRSIYRIMENKVWILAVIDGRRNVEDILLERFVER